MSRLLSEAPETPTPTLYHSPGAKAYVPTSSHLAWRTEVVHAHHPFLLVEAVLLTALDLSHNKVVDMSPGECHSSESLIASD